jgi:HSP20 family protein
MNIKNVSDKSTLLLNSLMAVPACQTRDRDTDWFPAVDLVETTQEYVFEVDLPGLKPEEIQFEVDSAGILISGNRLPGPSSVRLLRIERPSGVFLRQLPLPPDTTGEVLGSFCDGVLELRIPKQVTAENRIRARPIIVLAWIPASGLLAASQTNASGNRRITLPAYVQDVSKVRIWCAFAEVVLGEASFDHPLQLTSR